MRRLGAKALAWSALAMAIAGGTAGTGCKGTQPTEIVPGVSTQMVVTKDLDAIRIDLEVNGVIKFCQLYPVKSTGVVELPSTLGVLPEQSPNSIVTVTIRGYDVPGAAGPDIMNCPGTDDSPGTMGAAPVAQPTAANAATGNPRIIRRSVQSYVPGHVLFLPMPLTYSCQDVDCSAMGPTFACQGGQCLEQVVQTPSTLADYDPALYDGLGLCFSPKACFGPNGSAAVPATLLDADRCIYGFPSWDTQLGSGTNVRIFYKDITWQPTSGGGWEQVLAAAGEEEILNEDPVEGFTIVNSADAGLPEAAVIPGFDAGPEYNTSGPLIQLAPGLCSLAKAATTPPAHPATGSPAITYHTISDVQVASLCQPKVLLLPICADERNNSPLLPDSGTTATGTCNVAIPMDPAPSAIYLVMDQSVYMHGAYGTAGSAQALALSLTDPVFKQTFAAFKFLNDPTETDCSTAQPSSYLMPTLPFDVASSAQSHIANTLNAWVPTEQGKGTGTCSGMGTGAANGCAPSQYCYQGECYSPSPLDLQGAMLGTGAYQEVSAYLTQQQIVSPNIAGVMFIVNRAPLSDPPPGAVATPPEAEDCQSQPPTMPSLGCGNLASPALDECAALTNIETEAQNAFATSGLLTYFVVLGNDDGSLEPITFFNQVAADVPNGVTTLDATMLSGSAGQMEAGNFLTTITKLGTCLYQLPPDVAPGTPPASLEISFTAPGFPPGVGETTVGFDSTCSAANTASANGWNYDSTTRVRICGPPCTSLRNDVILAAATEAAVPVTIANLCTGTTAPAGGADASTSFGEPDANASAEDGGASDNVCSPANCMFGCCQGGQCLAGNQDNACGSGGNPCVSCGVGVCAGGACSGASSDASVDAGP